MSDPKSVLLEQARRAAERMKTLHPSVQAEVYLARGRESGIELKEGSLDALQESMQDGMGLRVLRDGRQGFAYGPGTDPEGLDALAERALAQLEQVERDEHRRLPGPSPVQDGPEERRLRESMEDPASLTRGLQERLAFLQEMEAEALRLDPRVKKVLRSGVGESRGASAVANTEGVWGWDAGTYCSLGLAVTLEADGEIQIGSASSSKRFWSDLDPRRAAADAVERGAALLGGKKLPTRRRSVVLDPWVAGEFLDLIAGALCADQVQRGKSMLGGKAGKAVASAQASFRDDPRLPKGLASALVDDEGVPTRAKTMIDKGVLLDFFHDTASASREGRASNGSAGRPSFKGIPRPGSSNFYLMPGAASREALLADTQDGVLVYEILGMHTADPVSGEFSVGISGVAIAGGRLTHGVKGAMVSGNVLEFLGRIDAVASDLTFHGSLGSPTFRIRDLTVA